MRTRRPGAVVLEVVALALAITGCRYDFSNPAEKLRAGQVTGRTVADPRATGVVGPEGGVSVSLKGSAFDQVTHDTGRFTMIPLPVGRHTLLFRKDTRFALVRQVEVALGPGGQPDGVSLGDVVIPSTAGVSGRVIGAAPVHGGIVLDEVSGSTGTVLRHGSYSLQPLSLGEHVLKFGMLDPGTGAEWVGGPMAVRLDESARGAVAHLADTPVHPAGSGTGTLRFRLSSLQDGLAPADILFAVQELARGPMPEASLPRPDAAGDVSLEVPEGIYRIQLAAPPAFAPLVTPPSPALAVVIAGEVADLGTLYLVPPGLPLEAQNVCAADDDCAGVPGSCVEGACQGWTPPLAAPASMPICPPSPISCSATAVCTTGTGEDGMCLPGGNKETGTCIPCGTDCTLNGVVLIHGDC